MRHTGNPDEASNVVSEGADDVLDLFKRIHESNFIDVPSKEVSSNSSTDSVKENEIPVADELLEEKPILDDKSISVRHSGFANEIIPRFKILLSRFQFII